MLYQISNGAVAFGDDVILHSIDFEIRNTEKIAIVGRNGCGKTTLLKLISGEVEMEKLDSDESAFIAKAGNPEIGYLKQIAFDDPDVTLEQEVRKCFVKMDERKAELARAAAELEHDYSDEKVARYTAMEEAFKDDGGYYYEKEYEVMIRKFGFSDDERKKPIRDFSGGQQTKIAFIKLLLSKPDILLLDEPTNHLDVTTIEWLEGYLKSYPKAVVVVSHDRMFRPAEGYRAFAAYGYALQGQADQDIHGAVKAEGYRPHGDYRGTGQVRQQDLPCQFPARKGDRKRCALYIRACNRL